MRRAVPTRSMVPGQPMQGDMLALKMLQDLGFMEDPVEKIACWGLDPGLDSDSKASPTSLSSSRFLSWKLGEDSDTRTGAASQHQQLQPAGSFPGPLGMDPGAIPVPGASSAPTVRRFGSEQWVAPAGRFSGTGNSSPQYPVRPGEPDCAYYMKTLMCSYGMSCKFNHPPAELVRQSLPGGLDPYLQQQHPYPIRPGQPECQFYMANGVCKFGMTCKFHHPPFPHLESVASRGSSAGSTGSAGRNLKGSGGSGQLLLNESGYPMRPGEKECAYFMKTGLCKYGATCKFHHPSLQERAALPSGGAGPGGVLAAATAGTAPGELGVSPPGNPPLPPPLWPLAAPQLPGYGFMGPPGFGVPGIGVPGIGMLTAIPGMAGVPGMPGVLGTPGPAEAPPVQTPAAGAAAAGGAAHSDQQLATLSAADLLRPGGGAVPSLPQRPGVQECKYYMKTGTCKFGLTCKFHHPPLEFPADTSTAVQQGLQQGGVQTQYVQAGPYNPSYSTSTTSQVEPGQHPQPNSRPFRLDLYLEQQASQPGVPPSPSMPQPVSLSILGLPLRPGMPPCPQYMQFAECRYGMLCSLDHPLPAVPGAAVPPLPMPLPSPTGPPPQLPLESPSAYGRTLLHLPSTLSSSAASIGEAQLESFRHMSLGRGEAHDSSDEDEAQGR